MKSVGIILCLCLSVSATAQITGVEFSPKNEYDSVRVQYIKPYSDYFFIWPVLKQRRLEFEMLDLPGKKSSLSYKSNRPYSFGVGAYLFELAFELTFAVPLNENSKRIYGESDSRDIQLNVLGKKWGVDLFNQKYTGFYVVDGKEKILPDTPYPQRPDIQTKNLGISTNYIFNNKKFSFRSAYNFVERQLTSRGSFLMFASLNTFKVSADSSIVGYKYNEFFGTDARIQKIRTTILGLAPGYTYSLLYNGFFLNGTVSVGPSHNWLMYEVEGGRTKNDINFNVFVITRLAIGYNGDKFFGGLSFVNQGLNAKFDNLQLTSSSSTFKILVGYRFREFGFLKNRIWDLPEKLIH